MGSPDMPAATMGEKMTYRIHFYHTDGSADHFDVSGETIEEIRQSAEAELAKRGGKDPWSVRMDR